jgi:hypothetical protein
MISPVFKEPKKALRIGDLRFSRTVSTSDRLLIYITYALYKEIHMLEKAVEILKGEVDIHNPQHVYKAVTHNRFGLGDILKKNVEHPLAVRALQLDHARKIAIIHSDRIEHLEKLVHAFLHGEVHDNIHIAKNNQRYALCGAFLMMHHQHIVQALPQHTLAEILVKHESIGQHIERLQAFQNGLEVDEESISFVMVKGDLTSKRNTLRVLRDELRRYAVIEKKRTQPPETIKEESVGNITPSTSDSADTITINIRNAADTNPLATPPSTGHGLQYSPGTEDSMSPIRLDSLPFPPPSQSSPYLTRSPVTGPQVVSSRSSSSPGDLAFPDSPSQSPLVRLDRSSSTPPPTLSQHDTVEMMLNTMKTKGQWTPSIARDLQENFFMTWIGQQTRETLLYLSGHMQNVQSGIVVDTRFTRIREDYFFIPNCNTSQWTKLRHAVKLAIIELQREDGVRIIIDGIEKIIVPDEKDEVNRAHLSWHAGRFFTHWGKTTTLTVYESDFIAQSKINPGR